jgi:hypothetical protein
MMGYYRNLEPLNVYNRLRSTGKILALKTIGTIGTAGTIGTGFF